MKCIVQCLLYIHVYYLLEIWKVLTARHKMMYDLTCMGRNSIRRVYLEKKNMTACIIDKNLEVGFYTQVLLYISFIPKKQNVMQNKN